MGSIFQRPLTLTKDDAVTRSVAISEWNCWRWYPTSNCPQHRVFGEGSLAVPALSGPCRAAWSWEEPALWPANPAGDQQGPEPGPRCRDGSPEPSPDSEIRFGLGRGMCHPCGTPSPPNLADRGFRRRSPPPPCPVRLQSEAFSPGPTCSARAPASPPPLRARWPSRPQALSPLLGLRPAWVACYRARMTEARPIASVPRHLSLIPWTRQIIP